MAGDKNELEKWATDVIFGRARGLGPSLMRIVLRGLSWIYRFGVRLRLPYFAAVGRANPVLARWW